MSSSRSDDVTRSVCLSVGSQFVLFVAFKAFQVRCQKVVVTRVSPGVSRFLQGVLRVSPRVFPGRSKGI